MGISVYPDGDYQHGATWHDANDRVAWQRTFAQGTDAQRRQAVAMLTANPDTPAEEIRANLTAEPPTTLPGVTKVSPTIDQVLNTPATAKLGPLYDRAPTDFSGTPAGQEATSQPMLNAY